MWRGFRRGLVSCGTEGMVRMPPFWVPWETQLGQRTTCLQGTGAAIGHQGLVLFAVVRLVLVVTRGLLLVLGGLSVVAGLEAVMGLVIAYLWACSSGRHRGCPASVEGRVVCWNKWPRICPFSACARSE